MEVKAHRPVGGHTSAWPVLFVALSVSSSCQKGLTRGLGEVASEVPGQTRVKLSGLDSLVVETAAAPESGGSLISLRLRDLLIDHGFFVRWKSFEGGHLVPQAVLDELGVFLRDAERAAEPRARCPASTPGIR